MMYSEQYFIRTKWWDSAFETEREGSFGPYDSQQEGEEMMLKIRKEHGSVQSIFFAELYRQSEVFLGSYSRARKRP